MTVKPWKLRSTVLKIVVLFLKIVFLQNSRQSAAFHLSLQFVIESIYSRANIALFV